MARVDIQTGAVSPHSKPSEVPKNKWRILEFEKRSFMVVHLKRDCRCLLTFYDEAGLMWEELGYESRDDMILNGYGLDPSEAKFAYEWLKKYAPQEAKRWDDVVLGAHGDETRFKGNPVQDVNHSLEHGTGNKAYTLARLKRSHPDILEALQRGEFPSVRQAAIAAGIVKVPTPLEKAVKAYEKLSDDERKEFLNHVRPQIHDE